MSAKMLKPPYAAVHVLGSLNMDIVTRVHKLPRAGETIASYDLRYLPGGKGGNQAVAAARMGAPVLFYGAVGMDSFGDVLVDFLSKNNVDASSVQRTQTSTGIAHVCVGDDGENQIVVTAGANSMARHAPSAFSEPALFLTQLECPAQAIMDFFSAARACGGVCLLNAAPAKAEGRILLHACDILIVNESELAFYLDRPELPGRDDLTAQAARTLLTRRDQTILLTRGAAGALLIDASQCAALPTRQVEAIDTTGAGDCFCGVLAARLLAGDDIKQAAALACLAASMAVTRIGASDSMPYADDLTELMQSFAAPHSSAD